MLTLSNGSDCIDIWPDDVLRVTLWNDSEEKGIARWSREPGCISLEYEKQHKRKIPSKYIKKIEVLEYSDARAMKGVRNE